jgi:hypothetical protein
LTYRTDDARALQRIADGEADAYITSTGKVFGLARSLENENGALHLVPVPYDRRLQDMYLPTTLSSEEYPNLLSPGESENRIQVSSDPFRREAVFRQFLEWERRKVAP